MKYATFLGKKMAQTEKAITLWERVLKRTDFTRIIEIGTFHGGFSIYLLLHTLGDRRKEFYTFDIINWRDYDHNPKIKNVLELDKYFYKMDVFENIDFIKKIFSKRGINILFCDGGDKEKEFNTFAPLMKPRDIIAVHDWGTEVHKENLNLDGFEEIFSNECDEEGMTKFFKKI